jgi:threonine/homoserine/homoserine lactone efflux protein
MTPKILEMLTMAFLIGLTGALAPGPTLIATVDSSLKTGWTAGPKIAAGHALVETVLFLLIVFGLAASAQQFSHAIAIIGGLALVAFGLLTMKGSRSASLVSTEKNSAGNAYFAGIVTSTANPYFWVWWLSVGSAFVIDGLQGGLIMAGFFMLGHWGADFGWYTVVSVSLDKGRSILSEANYRKILLVCGAFLVFFGLYYLIRA